MALLNKVTWKNKFSDFINRVSPFNTFPLIQKVEHEQLVGSDLGDSVIFRQPSVQVINSPLSAISVNFDLADRFDIDTTGSGDNAFTITLSGLQGNESGIINITKKTADTFVFSNADNAVLSNFRGQNGVSSLVFRIKNVNSFFLSEQIFPSFSFPGDQGTTGLGFGINLSGSGTSLPISEQSWRWERAGNIVHFQASIEGISASLGSSTSALQIDLRGTTFPSIEITTTNNIVTESPSFNVLFDMESSNPFDGIDTIATPSTFANRVLNLNHRLTSSSDFTRLINNGGLNLTSGDIQVSGTYITSDL